MNNDWKPYSEELESYAAYSEELKSYTDEELNRAWDHLESLPLTPDVEIKMTLFNAELDRRIRKQEMGPS